MSGNTFSIARSPGSLERALAQEAIAEGHQPPSHIPSARVKSNLFLELAEAGYQPAELGVAVRFREHIGRDPTFEELNYAILLFGPAERVKGRAANPALFAHAVQIAADESLQYPNAQSFGPMRDLIEMDGELTTYDAHVLAGIHQQHSLPLEDCLLHYKTAMPKLNSALARASTLEGLEPEQIEHMKEDIITAAILLSYYGVQNGQLADLPFDIAKAWAETGNPDCIDLEFVAGLVKDHETFTIYGEEILPYDPLQAERPGIDNRLDLAGRPAPTEEQASSTASVPEGVGPYNADQLTPLLRQYLPQSKARKAAVQLADWSPVVGHALTQGWVTTNGDNKVYIHTDPSTRTQETLREDQYVRASTGVYVVLGPESFFMSEQTMSPEPDKSESSVASLRFGTQHPELPDYAQPVAPTPDIVSAAFSVQDTHYGAAILASPFTTEDTEQLMEHLIS